ncbi:rod shape-determining protein MreC [Paenibacillus sp. YN15]|uniref:rod shape-determining protein MreC n=1 Tax=Paenibacillus sp. YN15 TaxID=1742774 RepID=UPI000DCD9226|nr:rod shape-determining protein MreC [Paenibacillus sp. YN15]RAV01207.1 rod shape-determining protein MreC [Paenibacillus sp. YN15]
MFRLLGNKKLLTLLLALMVFIALMGLTLSRRSELTWPERVIKDTVVWTQGWLYKPARYAAGFFQDIEDLKNTYQENKQLKKKLAQYAQDTMRLNMLEAQNKHLQEILGFTERQKNADNYQYMVAEVVSVSPDPYSNTVNINLGSLDGIKENMAVMSVEGLIGRVSRVSNFTSSVQLLVDMNTESVGSAERQLEKGISATVLGKEDKVFGTIDYYSNEEQGLIMSRIDQRSERNVEPGDIVVTSGLGQIFPKGLVIGEVSEKRVGDFGINYVATVKPKATDFRHLREVLVVKVPEVE